MKFLLIILIFLGALLVERPATIEEGFSQLAPLIYHFGHKSPDFNNTLYKIVISKLAEVTLERLQNRKGSPTILFA